MPPKTRITKEQIVSAGLELARQAGPEAINARAVASRLGCSARRTGRGGGAGPALYGPGGAAGPAPL